MYSRDMSNRQGRNAKGLQRSGQARDDHPRSFAAQESDAHVTTLLPLVRLLESQFMAMLCATARVRYADREPVQDH